MFIVALTGGIGSGKSEASNTFASLGIPIVDLDVISHQLTAPGQPIVRTLAAAFGQVYMTESGALDRTKMRQLVFDNPSARNQLNTILHPAILVEATKQIETHKQAPYVILAIPLLDQNSPYLTMVNRVLVIDCDEDTQISRVKQRSDLNANEVKQIIQAQIPRQARLNIANDIITNNGDINALRAKVMKLHQKYIKTCIVNKTIS